MQKFSCYFLLRRSSVRPHENGITQWMQFHLSDDLRLSLKGCHLCQGSTCVWTAYMRILPDHFVDPSPWKENISNWQNDVVVDSLSLLSPQQPPKKCFKLYCTDATRS